MRISDWSSDVCSSDLLKIEQDPYASLRRRFGARWPLWSFFSVYMLQGTILWIWCLPFAFAGQTAARTMQPLDWVGGALWAVGFAFQAIGDHQMNAFKADPEIGRAHV